MKTKLSDEELIKLNYQYNINQSYLFKVVGVYEAVFVDCITREIMFECGENYKKEIIKELKIEEE